MNTHLLALQLMAAQGLLGAFDTLYHHELTEALPQRSSARRELAIHATRATIYSLLFIGLSAWQWHGIWTAVLMIVFAVEIVLTLWDFVIEDRTRLLPASERITHTILAINGGAFITLLAINTPTWWSQPAGLVWTPYGFLSIFLFLCGVGVGLSGIRDAFASKKISRNDALEQSTPKIHFSDRRQNVLVTGATGFIGQNLIRALLANNHHVTILTRHPKQTAWLFDGKVQCVEHMKYLLSSDRFDVIVNLAGARILGWRWTSARKNVLRNSRIELTQTIIDWIARSEVKPSLMLTASAIGYYGIQAKNDNAPLSESSPPQSIFMSTLCQEWESTAAKAEQYGVHVIRMRFGLVLGHQGALPMMMLPIKLGIGGRLGRGSQWFSWIHVQDLIRGIAHLWQLHESGQPQPLADAFNFTSSQTVTQKEFNQISAKTLHRPNWLPTPGILIRLILGEQADLLLEGQRVIPMKLNATGFSFNYPDLQSALKSLI
ncbi:MAG TPA: TIGR01777 family oxidoreductase [Oxalicibacterium sp.]|uniref:TIGR01777 family oxidoreductase n=1 Tax=Oxalicibacterium sp. TaxID=2766525 RepID=UPI002C44A709|nr:TIGR01777 family oxidoreductase [Oxalicibacterium sp.]HWU96913.1 TIGR01777 family oxidoreductase [Oxalicibacterium sp.]